MAKKNTQQPELIITKLTIDKCEFKNALNERIILGEEIYNRTIQTSSEFKKMMSDFSAWTDYNTEYLKQSFNNPHNEYKRAYEDAGHSFFVSLGGNNKNPLQKKKEFIFAKIENLKKLVAKADLLKTSLTSTVSSTPQQAKVAVAMNEVFIVHGQDETAKTKTARFIEKLGLKPIYFMNKQVEARL